MRPKRLEIEGFASFRDNTVVELEDADLFVFFGPTGAGKSSLIDAVVFALYGSVPRYADKRLVAPVISQGLNEARVRLDFTAGGRPYTAVRVVQRTKTGATTKEARLESGTATLAGNADELTDQVTRLLGLTFEHFTRCVVLPQGAFAEFMHARAAERQDLLVQLLGLDLYERIREGAVRQGRELDARATVLAERLERELAGATEEAAGKAAERVEALQTLLSTIEAARPELEALAKEHRDAAEAARVAELRAKLLGGVKVPDHLDVLLRRLAEASSAASGAQDALDDAERQREAAEAERATLPERAVLDAASKTHADLREATTRLEAAEREAQDAAGKAKAAAGTRDAAERELREAEEALSAIQRERAAAHLAQHLVADESCPVCLQTVAQVPSHAAPRELADARQRRADAELELGRVRTLEQRAANAAAARDADVATARTLRDRLAREAVTRSQPDAIDALRVRIDAAETALAGARRAWTEAQRRLKDARDDAAALEGEQSRAWKAFDDVRDRLSAAALAPPPAARDDLPADWSALVRWAQARAPEQRTEAEERRAAAERALTTFDWKVDDLRAKCAAHDIDASSADPRDAVADALANARAAATRLRRDVEMAAAARTELGDVSKRANIAKDLGRHLDARNFERWLMTRALRRLVTGATQVLKELSGGAYSLDLDTRNDFVVIDHRNADERRMARTLSGGETFLASLSLALALAEQVAEVAAGGAARLEALFLDEGFGTLDAETLDVVATAIEELGSRGRTVGLVTHVRDLAERVPVRFEVRKVSGGSQVTRIG